MTGEETARVVPASAAPPTSAMPAPAVPAAALALTRAAQELELRRDEFQLAVQLGLVRTVPGGAGARGGRRRVERSEIDRLRSAPDFPAGLRDRVRTVGTGEAAALLAVPQDRFTRLARTGHFSPVRFYLNRYRAVVWLYLAGELGEFALAHPGLLTGRLPKQIRERVDGGEDRRPRNWRARRLGLLLRSTEDPWARAAAIASLLGPGQLSEVVDDPYERAHLDRLRPEPPSGRPESAVARDLVDRLTVADDPDEILWHRMSLALALGEARADRPAPRPDTAPAPDAPTPRPPRGFVLIRPPAHRPRRSLLDRLRRRRGTAGAEPEGRSRGRLPSET
ncbi:DUF6397 family protein [Streptomyces sp. NPDC001774]